MKKKNTLRGLIRFLVFLGCVFALSRLIQEFVIFRTLVYGESMMPTLMDGDTVLIERVSYRFSEPKRFDVIVFPYQYKEKVYYIKRVIALPGETVKIEKGSIYVNGSALIEHFGTDRIIEPGLAAETITLGPDEYFVLGDNRNCSTDSRSPDVGCIKRSDIVGKAVGFRNRVVS